jgi:hypothetical protein
LGYKHFSSTHNGGTFLSLFNKNIYSTKVSMVAESIQDLQYPHWSEFAIQTNGIGFKLAQ